MFAPKDSPDFGVYTMFVAPSKLGPFSGLVLDITGVHQGLALMAYALKDKKEAGIKVAHEVGTGETVLVVWVGKADSEEPDEGIGHPVIETPLDPEIQQLLAILSEKEEWCFGILDGDLCHLVYVKGTQIMGRQTWKIQEPPQEEGGKSRADPVETPELLFS